METPKNEFRYAPLGETEGRELSGLALPFNSEGRIGLTRERFAPGSIETTGDVIANLMHQRAKPIARQPETLELRIDSEGLHVRATLPNDIPAADEALAGVRANIYRGWSVEFRALRESCAAACA